MDNNNKLAEENQKRLKRVQVTEDFAQDFDIFADENIFEDFGEKIGQTFNDFSDVISEIDQQNENEQSDENLQDTKGEVKGNETIAQTLFNNLPRNNETNLEEEVVELEKFKPNMNFEEDSNLEQFNIDSNIVENTNHLESSQEELVNLENLEVEEQEVEEQEVEEEKYDSILDPSEVRVHYLKDEKFFDNENSILTFAFVEENISDYFELGFEDSDLDKSIGSLNKINTLGQETYKNLYIVGLGEKSEFNETRLREVSKKIFVELNEEVNIDLITTDFYNKKTLAKILTEEYLLCRYKVNQITESKKSSDDLHIYLSSDVNLEKIIDIAAIKANSQNLAKDLIYIPSNVLNPEIFVDFIENLSNELENVIVDVKDTKKLVDEEFGLITAVNQGSSKNAYLVTLEYNGDVDTKNYKSLIGKGITYDSGGYSLKGVKSLLDMHEDMSGAAISFATFIAVAKMKSKVNLRVILPISENLVNGNAYKPEDVIMSKSGKTVQIKTTDAEGRLVLADALTHAQSFESDEFITIATLTASDLLTGNKITPFFSNSNELSNDFIKSAIEENENVWPMPLNHFDNVLYDSVLNSSSIADVANKNYDQRAFATYGAEFIYYFLENKNNKYMHVDIGGQVRQDGKVVAPLTRTLINHFTK